MRSKEADEITSSICGVCCHSCRAKFYPCRSLFQSSRPRCRYSLGVRGNNSRYTYCVRCPDRLPSYLGRPDGRSWALHTRIGAEPQVFLRVLRYTWTSLLPATFCSSLCRNENQRLIDIFTCISALVLNPDGMIEVLATRR